MSMILKLLLNNEWYRWYKDIEEYNQNKKRKILIVFDDMIDDTIRNKRT